MQRTIFLIFLVTILFFCFSQNGLNMPRQAERKAFRAAEALFAKAEKIFADAGENEKLQEKADTAYQDALESFENLLPRVEASGYDSLAFYTRLRAAIISYYLNNPDQALTHYIHAFRFTNRITVADSILFVPYIYTGGIYYNTNQYDSAFYYYKQAEAIQEKYKQALPESQRLYNRLGVMLYENGNFRQARNYFEKAIELTDQSNINLIANYRINIASILVKLEDYKTAQSIYESLLPSGLFPNEINHNLGIIHTRLGDPNRALNHLRQTSYPDNRKNIDLYYNFTMAFDQLGLEDSAELYYHRAVAENLEWNGNRRNIPYGLLLKLRGDIFRHQGNYNEALKFYQQAVIQFHTGFNKSDPHENPGDFSLAFSYINLFHTLMAKGACFDTVYNQTKNLDDLKSSLDAYDAAFRLAHFIERTYDSDEARLFLNSVKHSAHSAPIDLCIRLHVITGEKKYLEQAYLFDQRNKASVLSLNMQENELRLQNTDPLVRKESQLRSSVTRLSIQAAGTADSSRLRSLQSQIRDAEIELGKIQDQISDQPEYRGMMISERIPDIADIQKKLDHKTALISWHLSEKNILALLIRKEIFTYHQAPLEPGFIASLDSLRFQLQSVTSAERYQGSTTAATIYNFLIKPIGREIQNMERLIIIPDDELSYIPFEALQDDSRNYLVNKFSIQYQFSTHFVDRRGKNPTAKGILAIAPFALRGYTDSSGDSFIPLPASRDEVSGLNGTILIDSIGSKKNFLASANKYGIIHLATHASVNQEAPGLSYIAFYPTEKDHKLYAREIYNLRLDSTDLVILSACETGMGKLVKGEGLMSLSRAFAFAGCPNIIMSLWMAEDKTTSYLTKKIHHYLDRDYTKDAALRQAKIDLLEDENIDPRFKTPNYWAHLMYIGDYEKKGQDKAWLWIASSLLIGGIIYLLFRKWKK